MFEALSIRPKSLFNNFKFVTCCGSWCDFRFIRARAGCLFCCSTLLAMATERCFFFSLVCINASKFNDMNFYDIEFFVRFFHRLSSRRRRRRPMMIRKKSLVCATLQVQEAIAHPTTDRPLRDILLSSFGFAVLRFRMKNYAFFSSWTSALLMFSRTAMNNSITNEIIEFPVSMEHRPIGIPASILLHFYLLTRFSCVQSRDLNGPNSLLCRILNALSLMYTECIECANKPHIVRNNCIEWMRLGYTLTYIRWIIKFKNRRKKLILLLWAALLLVRSGVNVHSDNWICGSERTQKYNE